MSNNLLDKQNALVMRGLAILVIMLHNFLHRPIFGFSKENETIYSQEKADAFWNAITTSLDTNLLGEFFSFLGWIGVPVFVFLTGYGITTKYPPQNSVSSTEYLWNNYIKLFFLMLPGILFFILLDIRDGSWVKILKKIFSLTMMNNFDYPRLKITPGVYWYFGLTFQYYVFYLFSRKSLNNAILVSTSVLSLLAYYLLGYYECEYATRVFRACFTGWLPLFFLGVWMAKDFKTIEIHKYSILSEFAMFLVLSVVLLVMNMSYELWIFVPVIALLWFMILTEIMMCSNKLVQLFKWLGIYSAFIFVSHPIARELCFLFHFVYLDLWVCLIVYVLMTLLIAFGYKLVYTNLVNRFLIK